MEIRDFALSIVETPTLSGKLQRPPPGLTDLAAGPPLRIGAPARPQELAFSQRRSRMPRPGALTEPARRAVALHRFANHELMAVEVMAWALLAFPDMPAAMRRGLVAILAEEQAHLALYLERLTEHGMAFGELPVNDYFWDKLPAWTHPLHYLAGMALTFEAANLDFAVEFGRAFSAAGDLATAQVLEQVHEDELGHVRFGLMWLRRLKQPEERDWDAYTSHLAWPLHPARSRGAVYHPELRRQVGMDEDFLAELEHLPTAGETMHPPRGPVLRAALPPER